MKNTDITTQAKDLIVDLIAFEGVELQDILAVLSDAKALVKLGISDLLLVEEAKGIASTILTKA